MESRTFTPKDPFKPSLQYSIQNIFLGRHKGFPGHSQLSQRPYPVFEEFPKDSVPNKRGNSSQENRDFIPAHAPSAVIFPPLRHTSMSRSSSMDRIPVPQRKGLITGKKDTHTSNLLSRAVPPSKLQKYTRHSSRHFSNSHGSETRDKDVNFPHPPSSDFDLVSLPSRTADNQPFGIEVYALAFVLDTLPRQIYLCFFLFLPLIYYSQVSRIFIDAQLSVYDMEKCILDEAVERASYIMRSLWRPAGQPLRRHVEVRNPYDDLEQAWKSFIDSLLREWNTLNIVSALLLPAIITILQIGNAGNDPLIRYTALLSMICALMSLLYGCVYVVRFGTMQKTYKAAEWAFEADKPQSGIFWNVWIMLALPATWLAWSIIFFIVCIVSFIWRTGTTVDENLGPMTPVKVLGAQTVVSFILALGIIYFILIVATLGTYGDIMDTAWDHHITGWVEMQDLPPRRHHQLNWQPPLNGRYRYPQWKGPSPSDTGIESEARQTFRPPPPGGILRIPSPALLPSDTSIENEAKQTVRPPPPHQLRHLPSSRILRAPSPFDTSVEDAYPRRILQQPPRHQRPWRMPPSGRSRDAQPPGPQQGNSREQQ